MQREREQVAAYFTLMKDGFRMSENDIAKVLGCTRAKLPVLRKHPERVRIIELERMRVFVEAKQQTVDQMQKAFKALEELEASSNE